MNINIDESYFPLTEYEQFSVPTYDVNHNFNPDTPIKFPNSDRQFKIIYVHRLHDMNGDECVFLWVKRI